MTGGSAAPVFSGSVTDITPPQAHPPLPPSGAAPLFRRHMGHFLPSSVQPNAPTKRVRQTALLPSLANPSSNPPDLHYRRWREARLLLRPVSAARRYDRMPCTSTLHPGAAGRYVQFSSIHASGGLRQRRLSHWPLNSQAPRPRDASTDLCATESSMPTDRSRHSLGDLNRLHLCSNT